MKQKYLKKDIYIYIYPEKRQQIIDELRLNASNQTSIFLKKNSIEKGVIFKNCALFINCKSEINNVKIDNAKDINVVMPMYIAIAQ